MTIRDMADASALPPISRDAGEPVFAEPWQAHAFALALTLHERGCFTWSEWARYLSQAIAEAQSAGDPDAGCTYYRHWLSALERLLLEKGLADPLSLASLRQSWQIAAQRTPHGQPIRLPRSALVHAGLMPADDADR
ncbi:MAG TPA: nitrile hydratase accessory protein [Zeimonas sp.]